MKTSSKLAGLSIALLITGLQGVHAGQTTSATSSSTEEESTSGSPFQTWWQGKYATGNWFGVRDTLAKYGLTLGGEIKGNFLAIVDGGLDQRTGYDQEIKFRGTLELDKLTGWEAIKGLSLYSDVRWRDGTGVNKFSGASSTFAPSTFQGGKQWRLLNAYATYTTPKAFGIKDFFTISGGWQNPSDIFIKQPESKFFLNNTLTSGRGISANGIPWGGSYAAWGGYARVKPSDWSYVSSGLYMAIPNGTNTRNHGLDFQGWRQDPELNGLYWITEVGLTPKIGPSQLPGRYAAGFIYWGVENTSFFGATYDQKVLLYWQADQMLFREPSEEAPVLGKGPSDGKSLVDDKDDKSFKAPVPGKPKLNDQGLYFFSLINFAPKYNNALPFYFHTGLIYKGLIPTRDEDQLGVALALGNYSYYQILADRDDGDFVNQTFEGVLEIDYRVQINKWAYFQPSFQYIIRPGGTGLVTNDTIFGFQFGVTF